MPPRPFFPRIPGMGRELSGAFGDLGTSLPLLLGLVFVGGMGLYNVLGVFGAFQIAVGWFYGIPVAVQPLKVLAAKVLLEPYPPGTILWAGLCVGILMLLFERLGLVAFLYRVTPLPVVRGIQGGLGITLILLALKKYLIPYGGAGVVLGILPLGFLLLLRGNRLLPPGLVVVALGFLLSALPTLRIPFPWELSGVKGGGELHRFTPGILSYPPPPLPILLPLVLPQFVLSLTNAVLSTQRLLKDLFPEEEQKVPWIPRTYALMNLVAPFLGSVPCCHGSGGIVGQYRFGARSGFSLMVYGAFFSLPLLVFPEGYPALLRHFPFPLLGGLLLIEGSGLLLFLRDQKGRRFLFALFLAFVSALLPYGFLLALLLGLLGHAWVMGRGKQEGA